MKKVVSIDVFYHDSHVGTLSRFKNISAFQYAPTWLNNGFSINPLSLPLKNDIFYAEREPFRGLFGTFADSLPDGWGSLITDRFLKFKGIDINEIDCFDRLTFLSDDSFGAFVYKPRMFDSDKTINSVDYDSLYSEFTNLQKEMESEQYDKLFSLSGSSGGTRPKANICINNRKWIIKYPSLYDSQEIGKQEFDYFATAAKCKITVPKYKLLPSSFNAGYFAIERFDFDSDNRKIHCLSASGLLDADYTLPCLDYKQLMQLTGYLTKSEEELTRMFRLMCFNVFAHNRDDHAKNFAFTCNENGIWKLSPAFDLTFSNFYNGWHATSVNGNGKNPDLNDVVSIGSMFLPEDYCKKTAAEIKSITESLIRTYSN